MCWNYERHSEPISGWYLVWSVIVWNSIKSGGVGASQGLFNQTVSERRAARWLHSAQPQTQTHPGPPHLPLSDTSQSGEKNNLASHTILLSSLYSPIVLWKEKEFPSPVLKKTRVKLVQNNPSQNNLQDSVCGHVFLQNFKIGKMAVS